MKIIFPELNNSTIKRAIKLCHNLEAIPTTDIESGCQLLMDNKADAIIAGINCTTRDMILACKKHIPICNKFFSSCFVMQKKSDTLILADGGVCKQVNSEILQAIIEQTYNTAKILLKEEPKIAMLSFSTFGSGGMDNSIKTIQKVIRNVRAIHPDIVIDGEMQLDVAINSSIAAKKDSHKSKVAGRANVLICPDLNSGNILYKSMKEFGGWTVAGPILQGFIKPIADLSRGSTIDDVRLTIKSLEKLHYAQNFKYSF